MFRSAISHFKNLLFFFKLSLELISNIFVFIVDILFQQRNKLCWRFRYFFSKLHSDLSAISEVFPTNNSWIRAFRRCDSATNCRVLWLIPNSPTVLFHRRCRHLFRLIGFLPTFISAQ